MASNLNIRIGCQALGVALCIANNAVAQGTHIDSSANGIDERFAIASKRVGDGKVQLHSQRNSRPDGMGGSTHSVHSFNCLEQTYEKVFEGERAPESFPAGGQGDKQQNLNKDSAALPLARHACQEHGLQILELRW